MPLVTRNQGNILFTKELHRRYQGRFYTIAVHPGVIRTDLTRYHGGFLQQLVVSAAFSLRVPVLMHPQGLSSETPENGALTSLYAASSPDATRHDGQASAPFLDTESLRQLIVHLTVSRSLWSRGATVWACA
jgi:NAD(P)-dependent dehydrogenase (short-subunit alcohol dehydrogenase family)